MKENEDYLGCKYWFEAYLQKSTLDGEAWNLTLNSILHDIGTLRTLKVIYHIDGNVVHYYFGANKDLTGLSNNLEKISLRKVNPQSINLPTPTQNEWLVQFVTGGNLLDLRERTGVNRGKTLEAAVLTLRQIAPQSVYCTADIVFAKADGSYSATRKRLFTMPGNLIAVNFRENEKYTYKKFSKHLDIQKSLHILKSDPIDALMEVETYPYMPQNAFLNLNSYDFDKHSLIIGASGSGKSKFIGLFADRLLRSPMAQGYRIVVIDPHAALESDLGTLPNSNVIRFSSRDDSTELFADGNTDIAASTELTLKLFESLLGKNYTTHVERLLRYSLLVLMTAQVMSLDNMKKLISDQTYRQQILQHVRDYIPSGASEYFHDEFVEVAQKNRSTIISPIFELVDEILVQSGHSPRSSQASSLAHVIGSNQLTIFSLNKVAMGEKAIKTVSGLLIQQLFLLAQARQFQEKIILIIDEVSVIQNPTLAQILAEARKYNLFVFLSQQYFGQVDEALQNAIFSNVSNYYAFKVSEADARSLEGNMTMELPRKMTMEATRIVTMEQDLRVPILTELDARECVVRVSSQGKILPAFRARTLDFEPISHVDSSQRLQSYNQQQLPQKFVEQQEITMPEAIMAEPSMPDNLMSILSRQSSQRNSVGGKKNER